MGFYRFISVFFVLLGGLAQAQSRLVVDWAQVRTGFEVGYDACPCMRSTVAATLISGEIRVGDLVVGTNGFVGFRYATLPVYDLGQPRLHQWVIGALRALHGPTGLGVHFDGVTVGTRVDMGYSDIVGTQLGLLWRAFHAGDFSLQLLAGYGYNAYRLNLTRPVERHRVVAGSELLWDDELLRLRVRALYAPDSGTGFAPESGRIDARLSALVRFRVWNVLRMGLGLDVGVEHDPWRELFGLAPDQFTGELFIEVSGASELPRELHP